MYTRAHIIRICKKILAIYYRIGLKNKSFTIISNNCWGGIIYDKFSLPYNTPTIGLWIPPRDYCKFLANLNYYLKQSVVQISYQDSHVYELLKKRKEEGRYNFNLDNLIIGRIVDVDIIFLHYNSFNDAKNKWEKRCKRVNFKNMLIKFNDQNECTYEDYKDFSKLDFEHKLFFTANKQWCNNSFDVFVQMFEKDGYVVNDTRNEIKMNIKEYLNKMI